MTLLRRTAVATCAATLLLLAGCTGSQPDDPATVNPVSPRPPTTASASPSPTAQPATTPIAAQVIFTGKVSTKKLPSCEYVRCWLPVQFAPALVENETVARWETWPKEGDEIDVVCTTQGKGYQNTLPETITLWYGVVVPVEQMEPGGAQRAIRVNDGYLGYVGSSWLIGDTGQRQPDCKSLTK